MQKFPTYPIDPVRLAKLRSIPFQRLYLMEGDGIQAQAAIIWRIIDGEHALQFANLQSGGFSAGDYNLTAAEAEEHYPKKCRRFDPTGWLNMAARLATGDEDPMELTVAVCPVTPWGHADRVTKVAGGIWRVSTPSHGGFFTSPTRHAAMPPELRVDDRWYEEDCDWARVVVAFPECFRPDEVVEARKGIERWQDFDLADKYGAPKQQEA